MKKQTDKVVRICHFSDLHLELETHPSALSLVSKRALGYLNLQLARGRTYKVWAFQHLLAEIVKEEADFVVMTGDVSSLSLKGEFELASKLLQNAGLKPETTMIVPGNHDRYTFGADRSNAFERAMSMWLPTGFKRKTGYPMARSAGPVLLLGLDTAVSRNAIRAAGRIKKRQIERLLELIEQGSARNQWPVVILHHPPFYRDGRLWQDYRNGLEGYQALVDLLEDRPATILHGHMHICSRRKIGALDVIGVPSAANVSGDPLTQLGYCIYEFSHSGLISGYRVRYWPTAGDPLLRFERTPLKGDSAKQ